jgi:hypothetical protein
LVTELRRGDVVLMVLLVKEEKGWNFGSTRIRMVAESEIAGRGNETWRCWCSTKLERRSSGDG